jgi:hypothetical protein
MNGVFSFVYCGPAGVGAGVFKIANSRLIGCDLGRVKYRGSAVENPTTGEISLELEQTVPAGVFLVQGVSAQEMTFIRSFSGKLPRDFDNGKPIEMFIPPASVTLMISRVSDEWEPYAHGIILTFKAEPPHPG